MTKRRTNWNTVAWTPFVASSYSAADLQRLRQLTGLDVEPHAQYRNSRYQVSVWYHEHPVFGRIAHASIKTHDKQARHDWRDLQRIKNEIFGAERDAVEIYPAESKRVDSANQYHLFVFRDYRLDIGFQTRLVSEEGWQGSRQRPFDPDTRPADLDATTLDERIKQSTRGVTE